MQKDRKRGKVNIQNKHLNPTLRRRTRFGLMKRGYYKLKIALVRYLGLYKFFFTILLLVGAFLFVNVKFWHFPSTAYKANPNPYVEIEGAKIVKKAQVMDCFRKFPVPKVPIYLMNTENISDAILKLSPVKRVYIRRFWFPARLKIVVEEKIPALAISPTSEAQPIAVFTEDAGIIGKEFLPLTPDYHTYLVLTYEDYKKWPAERVKSLIKLVKYVEESSGEKLAYIDLRNINDVYVQLQTVRLRVGDLNNTVVTRISRITSVLPQIKDLKSDINYIDLRWDTSTFIKLKDKNAPAPKPPAKPVAAKPKKV